MHDLENKPEGYVELNLDTVTICTSYVTNKQAFIYQRPYTVYVVRAGHFDRSRRDPEAGPPGTRSIRVTRWYSKALQEARKWCGWDWTPHPDKPADLP